MMTITIESVEHALEYYNDDNGHGLTYCNVKIGPWHKGPNISEILCGKCKTLVLAEEQKSAKAANAAGETVLTHGGIDVIAKVLLTNNDIIAAYERRGVTRREITLICMMAQDQIASKTNREE